MTNVSKQKAEQLKTVIEKTTVLPDYIKELYLQKLESDKYSIAWVNRIFEIIVEFEKYIAKKS